MNVPPPTVSPAEWRRAAAALPEHVQQALWEHALTSCPDCGVRGVPVSWAVVAVEAMRESPTPEPPRPRTG